MVTPGAFPSVHAFSHTLVIAHVMPKEVIFRRTGVSTLGPVVVFSAHHPVGVVQSVQRRRVSIVGPGRADVQRSMDSQGFKAPSVSCEWLKEKNTINMMVK